MISTATVSARRGPSRQAAGGDRATAKDGQEDEKFGRKERSCWGWLASKRRSKGTLIAPS